MPRLPGLEAGIGGWEVGQLGHSWPAGFLVLQVSTRDKFALWGILVSVTEKGRVVTGVSWVETKEDIANILQCKDRS